jgi:hypothetical protein
MIFTFSKNREAGDGSHIFLPPACRSDGKYLGAQYPIEGMLFQLDPNLTEDDFAKAGLTRESKIIARALQRYGMFLGDNGGALALQLQLLGNTGDKNISEWEKRFPGLYENIRRIATKHFRVVYTGEAMIKN